MHPASRRGSAPLAAFPYIGNRDALRATMAVGLYELKPDLVHAQGYFRAATRRTFTRLNC